MDAIIEPRPWYQQVVTLWNFVYGTLQPTVNDHAARIQALETHMVRSVQPPAGAAVASNRRADRGPYQQRRCPGYDPNASITYKYGTKWEMHYFYTHQVEGDDFIGYRCCNDYHRDKKAFMKHVWDVHATRVRT
ncbi:hypothetical protein HBI56_070500 [Parastagonospora nodorum]|uniref:Uncharacterized protein n=1 Tax=Phaeosphaeria nodorum (strain SN15 / ATCC MYA-4574 / FGSC 10173) TaxID=321614 RepID=A0A7U2EP35_PHANO|nr:hypothetical protein HBH56_004930 [Parastagonospora nodorum]QRC90377.1 hypothetical protein JI435_425300 [Parastagonospora nodorum SN15]KAH3937883.1 hypothetical protein HBH54_004920 [Parastagonospora nodorum]KAH3974972.1 hypothetical protein HBH51_087680 [Parastagonospora nodorum]KAH3978313.1 hypothetical protein HBH52_105070 [Parastagonospora nodorum]